MPDRNEQTGVDDAGVLWGGTGDWVLDEPLPTPEIVGEDPDTGEVKFKVHKPLTLREDAFVREYCKSFNRKAVQEKFGMTSAAAAGMLQRKHVKAAVVERAAAMAKASDMDETWVMKNLREVIERCMDGDKFDASCALRGLELVGKKFAMWTDRLQVAQTTVIRIESNVGFDPLAEVIDVTPTTAGAITNNQKVKEINHG